MGILKRIFWIIIVLGIIYFGYNFYISWWNGEQNLSRTKEYVQNIFTKKGNEIKGQVEKKANEYVSTVVGEAKESAFEYIKNKTSEAVSSIGKSIINQTAKFFGIDSSKTKPQEATISQSGVFKGGSMPMPQTQNFYTPPPPATITSNIGFPLVFSINSDVSYIVDWDDGTKDASSTIPNKVTLLTHSWNKEGDYTVKITVKNSNGLEEFIFPVRIYK